MAHAEDATEDSDGLGWYPDGVKRTLTDEQIAMFRHSEVQAILRARRHRNELKSSKSEATSDSESDVKALYQKPDMLAPSCTESAQNEVVEYVEEGEIDEEDDEEEYVRFLEKERLEFESVALSIKAKKARETLNSMDRIASTRRRVRELDAMACSNDVLDYGDEPTALPYTTKEGTGLKPCGPGQTVSTYGDNRTDKHEKDSPHGECGAVTGRKIWWPTIGSWDAFEKSNDS